MENKNISIRMAHLIRELNTETLKSLTYISNNKVNIIFFQYFGDNENPSNEDLLIAMDKSILFMEHKLYGIHLLGSHNSFPSPSSIIRIKIISPDEIIKRNLSRYFKLIKINGLRLVTCSRIGNTGQQYNLPFSLITE